MRDDGQILLCHQGPGQTQSGLASNLHGQRGFALQFAPRRGSILASRFDQIHHEYSGLQRRQALVLGPCAVLAAAAVVPQADSWAATMGALLATLVGVPMVLHRVLPLFLPPYRTWAQRAGAIKLELAGLRAHMAAVFGKYRERAKGERFKQAYDLSGRSVRDLEEALAVGMFREGREVFVTAFMRGGVAQRVTASIGSPFRCSAADDPAKWGGHVERLGCDEIRQYHNHPHHHGHTRPSATDARSTGQLQRLLGPHRSKLCSLIICWNGLQEWRVFQYDAEGQYALHFAFDAALDSQASLQRA